MNRIAAAVACRLTALLAACSGHNVSNACGEPVLLSNGFDDNGVANLSFEREFGKLIGLQDTLAKIIEDKNNRAIRFGVVNVASMAFLPI